MMWNFKNSQLLTPQCYSIPWLECLKAQTRLPNRYRNPIRYWMSSPSSTFQYAKSMKCFQLS